MCMCMRFFLLFLFFPDLFFLLGLDGGTLALRDHGSDLLGHFVDLGLHLVQDGVDLGFVVDVDLKERMYS